MNRCDAFNSRKPMHRSHSAASRGAAGRNAMARMGARLKGLAADGESRAAAARCMLAAAFLIALEGPVGAAVATSPALTQAGEAYARIQDYRMTLAMHEIDGNRTEDKTFTVLFKKPSLERIDVIGGADKGASAVWRGGTEVKAHHGGFLSGIHLTLNLHSKTVATLRGESMDQATIPALLTRFTTTAGSLSQAPASQTADGDAMEITLDVADPAANNGVTRHVLYVSNVTHLPVRWDSYVGATLVMHMEVKSLTTNVGLTVDDFPW